MQAYLSLLRRHPRFRLLWLAQLVSLLGDWFSTIAVVMLVNAYTGSTLAVGGFFLARSLPPFLAGPLAGLAADRLNRRSLLIAADLLRAGLVLGFLLVDRPERAWLIYVLAAAQFTVSAFFEPARAALVPQVVGGADLLPANVLSSVTWSAMLSLGAAVGGLVAAALGAPTALCIDSATFLASAWLISRIPAPDPPVHAAPAQSGRADLLAGLAYLRAQVNVGVTALVKGLGQLGSVDVLAAVYARRLFPLGEQGGAALGLMLAAMGLGTVLGPLLAGRLHDGAPRSLQRAIVGGYALSAGGWLLVGLAPTLPVVLAGWMLRGMGGSINWTYSDVLLQLRVPNRVLGRVYALDMAFFTLVASLGVWSNSVLLDGPLADPRRLALMLAGTGLAAALVWAGLLRLTGGPAHGAAPAAAGGPG